MDNPNRCVPANLHAVFAVWYGPGKAGINTPICPPPVIFILPPDWPPSE